MTDLKPLHIIGGGLAGSEAAWQAANCGVPVVLHEMRPIRKTDAHATDGLAELVCSNSFRSNDEDFNAVGLLHSEMRLLGSLIMKAGDRAKLPAGGALAVDRELFSQTVTKYIEGHPLITIKREEIPDLPVQDDQITIVATGPLTSEALSQSILSLTKNDALSFFDAIAPIIHKESIDFDKVWFQSRYDKKGPGGTGADYINCPMNKEQYTAFITALLEGEKTDFKEWEESTPYFDGCLPIEIMAQRGFETLRFGPMKPVGLTNPHDPEGDLYAVVQLRQDNQLGTLWNMVGFQTKLKYGAQSDVFRIIPGLERAEFARLGGLHRNTFLNSPELLDTQLRLKSHPHIRFAGQITGVEGYVESSAMGLMTGLMAAHQIKGVDLPQPPPTTAHGSLIAHITGGHIAPSMDEADDIEKKKTKAFQPMNVNFGLFPPIDVVFKKEPGQKRLARKDKRRIKRLAISQRARADLTNWKENLTDQA